MKTWSVVNRMRPGGVRLVSPDGEKVGAFPERYRWAAVQCAAAMNLTTASTHQRRRWCGRLQGRNLGTSIAQNTV